MSLIEINWSPTSRQLRQFGLLCVVLLPLVGWLWSAPTIVLWTLASVGAILAGLAFLRPQFVSPIFIGLIIMTAPIGMVIGELAMLLIYFAIFLPIGFVFRVLRRDALQLKIDRTAESYWQDKEPPKNAASYYRRY